MTDETSNSPENTSSSCTYPPLHSEEESPFEIYITQELSLAPATRLSLALQYTLGKIRTLIAPETSVTEQIDTPVSQTEKDIAVLLLQRLLKKTDDIDDIEAWSESKILYFATYFATSIYEGGLIEKSTCPDTPFNYQLPDIEDIKNNLNYTYSVLLNDYEEPATERQRPVSSTSSQGFLLSAFKNNAERNGVNIDNKPAELSSTYSGSLLHNEMNDEGELTNRDHDCSLFGDKPKLKRLHLTRG